MAKDLTIKMDDRPGTMAAATEAMAAAGINIEGLVGGGGFGHILTEDPEGTKRAIESAGGQVMGETDVLVLTLEDRPGALADVARKVADAGVNVEFVYVATGTRIVLGVSDLEKARAAVG